MPARNQLCICQICNCGRHKCPHRAPRPSSGQCQFTVYQNTYMGQRTEPSKSYKPAAGPPRPSSGAGGVTTQQFDFKAHPTQRRRVKSMEPCAERFGDFDHSTEYGRQYGAHAGAEAAKILYPRSKRRVSVPLESQTEQSTSFVAWPTQQRRTAAPPSEMYTASSEPMLMQTTTRDTYQGKKAWPAESKKPQERYNRSEEPMQGETTHDIDFGPKAVQARHVAKLASQYRPPRMPFDGITTVQDTYKQHAGVLPSKSFKPNPDLHRGDARLDDNTTHSDAFQAWRVQPRQPRPPERHVPPRGDLDTTTTHKQTFTNHGRTEPERARRPASRIRTRSEPMLAITTHSDAYKNWKVQPERPMRTQERYPPPKFEGTTESQSSFQGKQVKASSNFKPEDVAQKPMNFAGLTRYQEDYYQKVLLPCPAEGLKELGRTKTRNNLAFSHGTTSGHQIFVPMAGSVNGSTGKISIP